MEEQYNKVWKIQVEKYIKQNFVKKILSKLHIKCFLFSYKKLHVELFKTIYIRHGYVHSIPCKDSGVFTEVRKDISQLGKESGSRGPLVIILNKDIKIEKVLQCIYLNTSYIRKK